MRTCFSPSSGYSQCLRCPRQQPSSSQQIQPADRMSLLASFCGGVTICMSVVCYATVFLRPDRSSDCARCWAVRFIETTYLLVAGAPVRFHGRGPYVNMIKQRIWTLVCNISFDVLAVVVPFKAPPVLPKAYMFQKARNGILARS